MKTTKKRFILAVIMLTLVLSACSQAGLAGASSTVNAATVPSTPPPSQPSNWAAAHIETAVELGLVPDALRGNYQSPTTRAEFAAFAVALYEAVTGREITARMTFNDTDDLNVQKMGGLGVVTGVGGGNFNPNGTLTREQAAVMLARLSNVIGHALPVAPNNAFADNAQISSWAYQAIGQMGLAGIMGGTGNNMFSPQGNYTREQSIVTILRLHDILVVEVTSATPNNPIPTPEPPVTTPEPRQFNMNDPNVRLIPNFATSTTMEELRVAEEARLGVTHGGWQSAAERLAEVHSTHPDDLVDGMTVYEWRLRPIFAWVNDYLTINNIDIANMTDYEKTGIIRQIIEEGHLEAFIGLWRPNFRFTSGDCAPRAEAVSFLMMAMDFELFRQISGNVNVAHGFNAYWDSTVGAIRFVDADLGFGVWNLFVDELDARGFSLWAP